MEAGKTYHIYTHANGFENLFLSDENYRYFLSRYEHFIPSVADTLTWCLMPNHIHFLIRIKTETEIETAFKISQQSSSNQSSKVFTPTQKKLGGLEDGEFDKGLNGRDPIEKRISQQFSNLFNSYTKSFNKMYGRKGSLFIPNFKRKEITTDIHLTTIIHYIHANPVHHGFVKEIPAWPWTSYHDIIQNKPALVKRDEITHWFGSLNEFIKFHQQPVDVRTKMDFDA